MESPPIRIEITVKQESQPFATESLYSTSPTVLKKIGNNNNVHVFSSDYLDREDLAESNASRSIELAPTKLDVVMCDTATPFGGTSYRLSDYPSPDVHGHGYDPDMRKGAVNEAIQRNKMKKKKQVKLKKKQVKLNIGAGKFLCSICGFLAKNSNGLRVHKGRKHK